MWKATAICADIVFPGAGAVARVAHFGVDLVEGARKVREGGELIVGVSALDLGGGFSLDVCVKLRGSDRSSGWPFGAQFSESWPGLSALDVVSLSGGSTEPDAVKLVSTPKGQVRATGGSPTMEDLVRLAAERAYAAGDQGESWSPLVAAYLNSRRGTGKVQIVYYRAPCAFEIDMTVRRTCGCTERDCQHKDL
jgi:hypothetical protein